MIDVHINTLECVLAINIGFHKFPLCKEDQEEKALSNIKIGLL